ncbi:MAG: tRNA (N(6)-L-threonylcarbamoyladenosine(37)-C(2))-methylthiotransferase MtaB, partial [Treponemataceae bacterium]|nr:tRNA (N(6)-L-threonylcarbamoyladenosine(37)-C(2))-methylthiotransferase MtaB [Treponemataceae bacterium]
VCAAVERRRRAKPRPFLACDIIAGFPGETDEDFAQTMALLRKTDMTFVHAFPFSARPGTEAFAMRPMVPNAVAGARVAQLEAYSREAKAEYINAFVGAELAAVCESVHHAPASPDTVIAHAVTDNFLHCQLRFPGGSPRIPQPGSVIRVRVRRPLAENEKTGESDTLAERAD